ncbi:hypothetical protein SUGI_0334120 [Cryptomeria japonica]|uniref:cyclin-U2-1-like n=1 Tax=Cryptomeria japonica TaxID=3369 RepID=UPI002408B1C2|nr:cyclin-U2-1-like [Cryptomeria japonica]GLJ18726.1 hypothetical protein SUGI_0334120 [Cryptomeria japonica]
MREGLSCLVFSSTKNESNPCILAVLASLLHRLVARNERLLLSSGKSFTRENLCAFSAVEIPAMEIGKFLERIFKYSRCSPSAFVVAYVYIDRLILNNPTFRITSLNIHRLITTSVMVATKFLDDLHCNNSYFAKVGGLTLKEMNILEVEFLFMLRFRLHVTVSVFESYCSHFEREVALGGGIQIERTILCVS